MRRYIRRKAYGIILGLLLCITGLHLWTGSCEDAAHKEPEHPKVTIKDIVKKDIWSASDLDLLSQQTGLSGEALQYLKEQKKQGELPALQEAYYRPVIVKCRPNSIISKEEYLADEQGNRTEGMPIPYVEEGDILITCCSHVFGWRNGHAALVIDAKQRLVLEAQVLGSPSVITSLEAWERYPSFLVLRLEGVSKEERAQIAHAAEENLAGIPYRVSAGIWDRITGKDFPQQVSGTHCSHLVWYAYACFGYDLDSDGGWIVTPKDIAECEKLKVIQKYG